LSVVTRLLSTASILFGNWVAVYGFGKSTDYAIIY